MFPMSFDSVICIVIVMLILVLVVWDGDCQILEQIICNRTFYSCDAFIVADYYDGSM